MTAVLRRLLGAKKAFDPDRIMNPGCLFPPSEELS